MPVTEEDRETGLPVEKKKFIGAEPCGERAVVSWTKDGVVYHRCLLHAPRPPRDGASRDPLSIAGSERFKYKI